MVTLRFFNCLTIDRKYIMSLTSWNKKNFGLNITFVVLVVIVVMQLFSIFYVAHTESHDSTLIDRIKPLGQVYIEEDSNSVGNEEKVTANDKARSGKEIVSSSCSGCHSAGILGAPKIGNKDDWESLSQRGISELLKTAISGKGAMPPKGTCATCSDEELKSAIEYMMK
jgi:cytochrome c5